MFSVAWARREAEAADMITGEQVKTARKLLGSSPMTLALAAAEAVAPASAEEERWQMTLTQAHIELLRRLEAKSQASSVRPPPERHDLAQAGYVKIAPLNLQDSRVEIILAGRVALQRVTR
jgi:hypothetical protein